MKKILEKHAWIFLALFFALTFIDIRFGGLALFCMLLPGVFAFFQKKSSFCGKVCPRGSFLKQIVSHFSLKIKPPAFLTSNVAKGLVLVYFLFMISFTLLTKGVSLKILGMLFTKMLIISTFVALVLGSIFKPKTWCKVCPIGLSIRTAVNNNVGKLTEPIVILTQETKTIKKVS